jgi:hypothetical protein
MAVERANDVIDVQPSWQLVFRLFGLIGRLLGYGSFKGALLHSISYWQTESQYLTADILTGGTGEQLYEDKKDAVSDLPPVVVPAAM